VADCEWPEFLRGVRVEHETFSLCADLADCVFSSANAEVFLRAAKNVICVVLIEQGGESFRSKFTTTICLDLLGVNGEVCNEPLICVNEIALVCDKVDIFSAAKITNEDNIVVHASVCACFDFP
jgi:hypothetical protein